MALVRAMWEAFLPDGKFELSISNTSGPEGNGCSVIYSLRCSNPECITVLQPAPGGGEEIPDGVLLPGERRLVTLMRKTSSSTSSSSSSDSDSPASLTQEAHEQQPKRLQHYASSLQQKEAISSMCTVGCTSATNSSVRDAICTKASSQCAAATNGGDGTSVHTAHARMDPLYPYGASVQSDKFFFIVCYRRLGDTSGCLRAAIRWIQSEQKKYAAWVARAQWLRPAGDTSPLPPALGEPVRWMSEAPHLAGLRFPAGRSGPAWIEPRSPVCRRAAKLFRSRARFGAGFALLSYRPPRHAAEAETEVGARDGRSRAGQGLQLFAVSESLHRMDGGGPSPDTASNSRTQTELDENPATPRAMSSTSGEKDAALDKTTGRLTPIAEDPAEPEPGAGLIGSFVGGLLGTRGVELHKTPPRFSRTGDLSVPHNGPARTWRRLLGQGGLHGFPRRKPKEPQTLPSVVYPPMGIVDVGDALRTIAPVMLKAVDAAVSTVATASLHVVEALEDSADMLHAIGLLTLLLASLCLLWVMFVGDNEDILEATMESLY